MPYAATTLHYVADPMCSWCWGFAPVLAALEPRLAPHVSLQLVLGGLAPDDETPMPDATRASVQAAWEAVAERTGARFNHDFWTRCAPRRSTWPACRAVLAAGHDGRAMFAAIQRAYYLEARNPSDTATLIELAGELGLDPDDFAGRLASAETQRALERDFALRDTLAVHSFPGLVASTGDELRPVTRGWVDEATLTTALSAQGLLAPT
jgi:putative protein-disulfide isomerase